MQDGYPIDTAFFARLDALRAAGGWLGLGELLAVVGQDNTLLDPFSTLVARGVRLGRGNVLHPAVTLGRGGDGALALGDGNVLYPGTTIAAEAGTVTIGNGNRFGEGGVLIKAGRAGGVIRIGDEGRYMRGCDIRNAAELGSGSQVLGPVTVEDCSLAAGGSFMTADPDRRGAVLKGAGAARHLQVPTGHVISAYGDFLMQDMKPQSFFHPR